MAAPSVPPLNATANATSGIDPTCRPRRRSLVANIAAGRRPRVWIGVLGFGLIHLIEHVI
jgi:hypothetical protein